MSHLNVQNILDAIKFKIGVPLECVDMTIFLAIKERTSYIDMIDNDGKQNIIDLTYADTKRIFKNLKKNFDFPKYIQSLSIYMNIDSTMPKFIIEYFPSEKTKQ